MVYVWRKSIRKKYILFFTENINFVNKNTIFWFVVDDIGKFQNITIDDFQFNSDKQKKKFQEEHFDKYDFKQLMQEAKKVVIKKHDQLVQIYDEWIKHYDIQFYAKETNWETHEIPPKYRRKIPKKKIVEKKKKNEKTKKKLSDLLISDDESQNNSDDDDNKYDSNDAISGKDACNYYESIKFTRKDTEKLPIYQDKPYKWWFDHRNDPKLFYLEKIQKVHFTDPVTNNIAERGYKTSRGLINYQTSQLGNVKINQKQVIMDHINKKNKLKTSYTLWPESDDSENDDDDDDDDDDVPIRPVRNVEDKRKKKKQKKKSYGKKLYF